MLSYGLISASQCGQCDGGRTIDSWRGTRQITTLRNEPIIRPSTPHTTTRNAVMAGEATAASRRRCGPWGYGH